MEDEKKEDGEYRAPATLGEAAVFGFSLGKKLGEGAYGLVLRGTHLPTSRAVAIKVMDKSEITAKGAEERVRTEIKGLRLCSDHPHVIMLYRVYETPSSEHLAFEFAGGGDLLGHIKSQKEMKLDREEARRFFRQIASGVAHMHSRLVAHRDLKPENLILDEARQNVKITDFGFCRMLSSSDERLTTPCGSLHFCAPEVLEAPEESYCGPPADVWSCGIILYGMLRGEHPFDGTTREETAALIREGDFDTYKLHNNEWDMIKNLLTLDPKERTGSGEILKHAYCQKGKSKDLPRVSVSLQMGCEEIDQEIVSRVVQLHANPGEQGKEVIVTSELVEKAMALSHEEMGVVLGDDMNTAEDKTEIEKLLDVRCTYEILLQEKMEGNKLASEELTGKAKIHKSIIWGDCYR